MRRYKSRSVGGKKFLKERKESKREEKERGVSIKRRREAERRKNRGEREGRRGESVVGEQQQPCSVLQVFSSPSRRLLPHRGDLDLEECAPCSEGRRRNSSGSLTHFSVPPTRLSSVPFAVSSSSPLRRRAASRPRNEAGFFFHRVCRGAVEVCV